jgi:hypothetical protein
MPYSVYELIRCGLDDHVLQSTDTTIILSDRTLLKFDGILRNIYVNVGSFVYPIDFYILSMPRDPFCPILLGRPFFAITKANINSREGFISLHFGEEEMSFRFADIKRKPYEKVVEFKEERTIAELAAIYFDTPGDGLQRSLLNYEDIPNDEEEDPPYYFDNAPKLEGLLNKVYEPLERKGDEALPLPELKILPEGLKYEYVDEEKKKPYIINEDLSLEQAQKLLDLLRAQDEAFFSLS